MTMGDRIAVLRDGLLQQLDTPQALYDRPANTFVAGFIGTPEMNMLGMDVHSEGGNVELVRDGLRLPVPARYLGTLRTLHGNAVTVGLRPEDLSESAEPDWTAAPLPVVVEVLEPLGSEAFLYGQASGTSVISRVNPRGHFEIGSAITLQANTDRMHVFDAETGVNLLQQAEQLVGV
jgi:ABC-type sugar transport system ATPase subunit